MTEGSRVARYPDVNRRERLAGVKIPGPHDQGPLFTWCHTQFCQMSACILALQAPADCL